MANELKVRELGCGGLVEDNPLTAAATTLTSAGLATLRVIDTTNHAVVIYNPDSVGFAPFAKRITAHASLAGTATQEAAAYFGTAVDCPVGTPWIIGIVANDFTSVQFKRRTSGDLTLNSTNWADVDTGLDITIAALAGDVLEATPGFLWSNQAVDGWLDVVTVVSAAPLNSFIGAGAVTTAGPPYGVWRGPASVDTVVGPPVCYTVVTGDIVSGFVTCRLRYKTGTATNKTLSAGTNYPGVWTLKNLGPVGT